MNELEQKILNKINEYNKVGAQFGDGKSNQDDVRIAFRQIEKELDDLFNQLILFPTCSNEFIMHPDLIKYSSFIRDVHVNFWLMLQKYLHTQDPKILVEAEENIKEIKGMKKEDKSLMASLSLPERQRALHHPALIRAIYLSKNKLLIEMFQKYFPNLPKPEVFKGYEIPPEVMKKQNESKKVLQQFFEKHSPEKVEQLAIRMQRIHRAKKRQAEEKKRIEEVYGEFIKSSGEKVEDLMKEANTPYVPKKCDPALANRIVKASNDVVLFSEIKHLTTVTHARSILDEGLYGRATLEAFFMNFHPAALGHWDMKDGDANVICFGPFNIDPRLAKESKEHLLEVILDVEKIQKDNPCIFFKQRDFGYHRDFTRTVVLGGESLKFYHTKKHDYGNDFVEFYIKTGQGRNDLASAKLPKFQLIAYDFAHIHQILTLNFFRFLDKLSSPDFTKTIYAKIAKLNDQELVSFLREVGMALSDTSEFNFYGAHQIDFSAVIKINVPGYSLHLPKFIGLLQAGNVAELKNAQEKIPQLFESYRFLDYLLLKVNHEAVKKELLEIRNKCQVPFWQDEKQVSLAQKAKKQL